MKKDRLQTLFLEQLTKLPIISIAAEKAGVARRTVYNWREDPEFAKQMEGEDSMGPQTTEPDGLPVKADGNNVSIDRESRMLAENAMRFQVAASLAQSELHSIKSAIQESAS